MKSLSAVPIRLAQSLRSFDYIWRSLRRSRQGTIGLLIVIVHMFIAVASPYIVPYSHHDIDGKNRLAAPSVEHPFGTDSFGRDLFTRVLLGGRAAIGVASVGRGDRGFMGRAARHSARVYRRAG